MPRSRRRPLLLALLTLAAVLALTTGVATAGWGPPAAVSPAARDVALLGVAARSGDRPAVLLDARGNGGHTLELRTTARTGGTLGAPIPLAASHNDFEGEGLAAGSDGDLVAAWLEIVHGSRRPVVATGPRLEHRQVLAAGPRSSQIMDFAANRRGDAVVAFMRYHGSGEQIFASYRPAGGRFEAPQLLSADSAGWPVVAVGDDGRAGVAWNAYRAGVQVAERAPGQGARFGAATTVPGSERPGFEPGLAEEAGRAMVAWAQPGNAGRVLVAARAAGSTGWSAPQTLSRAGVRIPRSMVPAVTLSATRAVVAWVDGVPHDVSHDRAEIVAGSPAGDRWDATFARSVRAPAHVSAVDVLAAAPGRLAQLILTTSRGGHRGVETATILPAGEPGPERVVPVGGTELGRSPFAAQGAHHTWLGLDRWTYPPGRDQALLVSSAS